MRIIAITNNAISFRVIKISYRVEMIFIFATTTTARVVFNF